MGMPLANNDFQFGKMVLDLDHTFWIFKIYLKTKRFTVMCPLEILLAIRLGSQKVY
jgi:hypothetical protein